MQLLLALRKAGNSRVISLSSCRHQHGRVDFDDPNFECRPYDRWQAYAQSKTANSLFAVGLEKHEEPNGIRAFAVHPGTIMTGLTRHMTDDELQSYGLSHEDKPGFVPAGQSVAEGGEFKTLEQGAATSVWCATSPQLAGMGGVYCEDHDVAKIVPPVSTSNVGVQEYAIDPEEAKRLWVLIERLTGIRFDH